MKLPTVTIGIPAYNEAATIDSLIKKLLAQRQTYRLDEIVIVSDGSNDATTEIVTTFSKPVVLVTNRTRRGKPYAVNKIFARAKSDIVVILDADLKIASDKVISTIIKPLVDNPRVQLASALAAHERVHNLPSRIALASNQIWEKAITYPKQHDLYLCSGSVRAFGRKLYRKLRFQDYSADDAYAYLACRHAGHEFAYVPGVDILQKLPTTLHDFLSQTTRFIESKNIQHKMFPSNFVEQYYTVTWKDKLRASLWYMSKDPLAEISYLVLRIYVSFQRIFGHTNQSSLWQIVRSTKGNT